METADFRMAEAENISAEPDPAPRRRRGRPAGLGKVPGSGRKKGSTRVALDDMLGEAENFLLDVLAGKQFYAGPGSSVGKAGWQYPSATMRMKAALALLDRAHPTLTAAKIDSDVTTHGDGVERDPRQLARAVMELFRESVAADGDDTAEPPEPPPLSGAWASGPVRSPDTPARPLAIVGDREPAGTCTIELVRIAGDGRESWRVFDPSGAALTTKWGRDAAREAAADYERKVSP